MKKNLLFIFTVITLIFWSCDTKKVDQSIAKEIHELKDSLKIEPKKDSTRLSALTINRNVVSMSNDTLTLREALDSVKGKPVLLYIWASWCPDCVKGFKNLKKLQEKYPETSYVFISLDKNSEEWKNAVKKYKLEANHFYLNEKMKGEFGQSIDLTWIPRYMVLDEKGEVALYRSISAQDTLLLQTLENL